MKLKLVKNWRRILLKAWSCRLAYFAAALGVGAEFVPYLNLPTRVVLPLGAALAVLARILAQQGEGDA